MKKPSPQFSLALRVVFIARIVFLGTFVGAAFLVVALDNITNSASHVPRAESITSDDRLTPQAATFLVNTLADTADTNIGDGHCDTDANLGNGDQCTLRAAIQEANALAGDDTINFS